MNFFYFFVLACSGADNIKHTSSFNWHLFSQEVREDEIIINSQSGNTNEEIINSKVLGDNIVDDIDMMLLIIIIINFVVSIMASFASLFICCLKRKDNMASTWDIFKKITIDGYLGIIKAVFIYISFILLGKYGFYKIAECMAKLLEQIFRFILF